MKRRLMKTRLRIISGKMWLAVCGIVLIAGISFGIATRSSYTNFDAHPDELAELPYFYAVADSEVVALTSENTLRHGAAQGEAAVNSLVDETPIIVKGIFEGNRTYVYQSFVAEVRLTEVFRGEGLEAGQTIELFEPVSIQRLPGVSSWRESQPDSYQAFTNRFNLAVDESPYVLRPVSVAYFFCGTMKEGQEYLFFLSPKVYPEQKDRTNLSQEYVLQDSIYSRIAISPKPPTLDVAALDQEHDFINMQESQNYSFIVGNTADEELYRQTCNMILERVSSHSL